VQYESFTAEGWRKSAYVLGSLAIVCWVGFALLLGDDTRGPSAVPWLSMAVAVSFTVFSATCSVLCALVGMEERLRKRVS
jgi:hypothetical protein